MLSLTAEPSKESASSTAAVVETFWGDGYGSGYNDACLVTLAINRDTGVQSEFALFDFDDVVYRRFLVQRYLERTLGSVHGDYIASNGLNCPGESSATEPEIACRATPASTSGTAETTGLTRELPSQLLEVFGGRVAGLESGLQFGYSFGVDLRFCELSLGA